MGFMCGILILSLIINLTVGQKWSWGSCPKLTAMENFDLPQYLGTWYEIQRYPNSFESRDSRCISAEYTLDPDLPGRIIVNNTAIKSNNGVSTAIGSAYQISEMTDAKLKVRFNKWSPYTNYWVLDTDYTGHSLVWSCVDLKLFNLKYLWILHRERHPSAEDVQNWRDDLRERFHINVNYLVPAIQHDCEV